MLHCVILVFLMEKRLRSVKHIYPPKPDSLSIDPNSNWISRTLNLVDLDLSDILPVLHIPTNGSDLFAS